MNEIEKLYELAGIYPDCEHGECGLDYCANNYGCGYAFYPPFTAEKQLELIRQICPSYPLNYHLKCFQDYTFEDGLAKCVNNIWQCVTETEQEETRNILKG